MDDQRVKYFDNSATTIHKPPGVLAAIEYALKNYGNAGRSFYDYATDAAREVYRARTALAKLFSIEDPLNIAFTSSVTESLNLLIYGMFDAGDHVITTRCEHNSVLRPLYNSGAALSFLDTDEKGRILTDSMEKHLRPNTKAIICTHGSNLTGNVTDVSAIRAFCRDHNVLMILDASQTAGVFETNADMADFICFTGHKGLLGPQGTGGIAFCGKTWNDRFFVRIRKTGGTGSNTFDRLQPDMMPDVFEAGTHNVHSLSGLRAGCEYITEKTVKEIQAEEAALSRLFIAGLNEIKEVEFYGDIEASERLPIVAMNLKGQTSEEVSYKLWSSYAIATRPGSHCAPLLHEHFNTKDRGIVRFSFSHFNTKDEIMYAVKAIGEIASS
jgi:cysteine desulfurase family protein